MQPWISLDVASTARQGCGLAASGALAWGSTDEHPPRLSLLRGEQAQRSTAPHAAGPGDIRGKQAAHELLQALGVGFLGHRLRMISALAKVDVVEV